MRYQNRYSNIVVLFFILPVLLIFLFGSPAFADYQKGLDAAKSGDYATALKEWKPLAEQGMPMPRMVWVFCTTLEMVSPKTIRLR